MKMSGHKSAESANRAVYLTSQLIRRLVPAAYKKASIEAMATMGYVVKVQDDWIVREFADGTKEKLVQLAKRTFDPSGLD